MKAINFTKLFIITLLLLNVSVKAQESIELSQQMISSCEPKSGIPGTVVTIYGNGFSTIISENTIEFGSFTANIISATANVITAEIPEGPVGPVDLWHWRSSMGTRWAESFIVLLPGVTHYYFGDRQTINSSFTDMTNLSVSDLDTDTDMDVLLTSRNDNKIVWYQNQGGGNFGAQQLIDSPSGPESVSTGDINEDGSLDVLSAIFYGDMVVWYPNLGSGNFGTQQIITQTNAEGAFRAIASDVDFDGDLDVLSALYLEDKIVWQENLGGGSFGQQQIIDSQVDGPWCLFSCDLDGDGFLDVLAASAGPSGYMTTWYKNLGGGNFGSQTVIDDSTSRYVFPTDLDGDGDIDIIFGYNSFGWYENLGAGNFATNLIESYCAQDIYPADLDGDGDIDIITSCPGWEMAWYENVGSGTFEEHMLISSNSDVYEIFVSDLDEDGDLDILSASRNALWWQENFSSPASIMVALPNGGENWVVGEQRNITWTSQDVNNVKLEYSTNTGSDWMLISSSTPASSGSHSWIIPNTPSNQCLVKISDAVNSAVYDESDGVFTISPSPIPVISVSSPNGGENWVVGSQEYITWTNQDVNNVKIEYSTNTGSDWMLISSSTPASSGSFNWTVLPPLSDQCLVRISDAVNPAVYDESDGVFTISPSPIPVISVSSPNGGENWVVGSQEYITWTNQDVNNVKIEYSTNTGSDWMLILSSTPASSGSFNWTVLPPLSDQCLVRISDAANPAVNDESNNVFSIIGSGPIITVFPTTLSFGDVKVNNISQRTFTVENEASATADLDVIDIDCGNNAFTVTPNNFILIPSDSQVVTVTFTPTVATTYNGTINIDCNASGSPSIIVSGIGFEFPNEINVSTSYTFGDFKQRSSYKIVGIPGDEDLPLSNYVSGTPGKEGDWRAFRDPTGSGSYTEYTSGSTSFKFGEGRAFWVLSKSTININPGNVSTVPLSADNSYFITPLNNGWNLITNPFKKNIPWNDVQTLNGITQSIEDYQSGGYIEPPPSQFEYYKGYYFYNSTGLPRLEIPYVSPEGTPLLKQQIEISEELEIALAIDGERKSAITIGFTEEAKPGVDKLDIFSPPSTFCVINLALYSEELESNYKYLDKEYREQIGEGQEFEIKLKNTTGKRLELITEGIENFDQYELYLLDKRLNKLYNLKEQNKVDVKRSVKSGDYSLIVGTEEYILEKKSNLLPEDYLLYQNYPNPFNPLTTIRFAMPKGGSVRLDVYNMLGELVTKLIDNKEYEAGYHEVEFSAIGGDASNLASGVYIYRLMAGEFVNVKKMILLK